MIDNQSADKTGADLLLASLSEDRSASLITLLADES